MTFEDFNEAISLLEEIEIAKWMSPEEGEKPLSSMLSIKTEADFKKRKEAWKAQYQNFLQRFQKIVEVENMNNERLKTLELHGGKMKIQSGTEQI